jgi:hypothetical protein
MGHITVVPSFFLRVIRGQEEKELLAAVLPSSKHSGEKSTGDEPVVLFRAKARYDCK